MIGIDVVEINDIDENKLIKILSPIEREYLDKSTNIERRREVLAGLFAGKEAVFKALECDSLGLEIMKDIVIAHEDSGRPYVIYKGTRIPMKLSISHSKSTAVAVAINLA